MKGDLACVIQDKLALEERLQKNNEMLKALQAVSQSIFSRSNTVLFNMSRTPYIVF